MIGARDSVIFALPLPQAGEGERDWLTISAVNIWSARLAHRTGRTQRSDFRLCTSGGTQQLIRMLAKGGRRLPYARWFAVKDRRRARLHHAATLWMVNFYDAVAMQNAFVG